MARTSILDPGTTADNSSDISVGQNEFVTVGLYVTVGEIPDNCRFVIMQKTPGAPFKLANLLPRAPLVIAAAGTYYVTRKQAGNAAGDSATPVAVGVFKEQGA